MTATDFSKAMRANHELSSIETDDGVIYAVSMCVFIEARGG